jgi:hypothetical protein
VTAVYPASGAVGVDPANVKVLATFDEALDASSVTGTSFRLIDPDGFQISATIGYNPDTRTARLAPTAALAYDTQYTATVNGVTDVAGNKLASGTKWTFTTSPSPAPPAGGGNQAPPSSTGGGSNTPPLPAIGAGALVPPPIIPVADTTAPRVKVGPASIRVTMAGDAAVQVGCPRGEVRCQVRLRLIRGNRTLGTATVTVTGGAKRTVRIRLTRAAQRDLARSRSTVATVVSLATDASGNRATARTRIRLLAPSVKHIARQTTRRPHWA